MGDPLVFYRNQRWKHWVFGRFACSLVLLLCFFKSPLFTQTFVEDKVARLCAVDSRCLIISKEIVDDIR